MKLLERDRFGDGNHERGVAVDILAEEHSLCPGLLREVDLALLHRNLPRRGFARSAGLGPDHLDREHIAGKQQHLFRDPREGERFEGYFD